MGKAREAQKRLCRQLPARQQQAANAKACRCDQSTAVNLECHSWNFPLACAQGAIIPRAAVCKSIMRILNDNRGP